MSEGKLHWKLKLQPSNPLNRGSEDSAAYSTAEGSSCAQPGFTAVAIIAQIIAQKFSSDDTEVCEEIRFVQSLASQINRQHVQLLNNATHFINYIIIFLLTFWDVCIFSHPIKVQSFNYHLWANSQCACFNKAFSFIFINEQVYLSILIFHD